MPTGTFSIVEPHDRGIGESYILRERHATDFEAPKLYSQDTTPPQKKSWRQIGRHADFLVSRLKTF